MGVRLPTILGKAIEDTIRTLNEQYSEDRVVDLVRCIERMEDLMVDLSGNAKLRPIVDDSEADVALWNKEIAKYFQGERINLRLCYCAKLTVPIIRQRFYECTLVVCGSVQIPSSPRVFQCKQILDRLRCFLPSKGIIFGCIL
jgi:hypothetical protein